MYKYLTMGTHPYIKLIVNTELKPSDAKLWLGTAQSALPSGLPAETEITINGKRKSTEFYKIKSNGSWCYIVPLSRDPSVEEAKAVTLAWNIAYPDGDFEIDYSSTGSVAELHKDIETNGIREIAMEAAKLSHNSWLTEMNKRGWSYGIKFNQRAKKNPNILPWDQLGVRYQLQELKRFEKLMEILHNMKLKLVRK